MKFFAYDDKMFSPLLQTILQDVECLGVARLKGYQLSFHNRSSQDQSGKCNLVRVRDSDEYVYGVLYEVLSREKHLLDKAESLGYGNQEITLKVEPLSGILNEETPCYVFTYVAHKENVYEDLLPYTWYKELVLSGAKEHHFPKSYIQYLEQTPAMNDSNATRETKNKRFLDAHFL